MRKSLIATCLVLACGALLAPAAGAAPRAGTLDRSFAGGLALLGFGLEPGSGGATRVALQADGKAVALIPGTQSPIGFSLARFAADGTLDPSFGSGGYVNGDFGAAASSAVDLALQPDGKILVAGGAWGPPGFVVARYNADGQVDSSFGDGGIARFVGGPQGVGGITGGMLLQPDGKIVVSGTDSVNAQDELEVVRFHGNGRIDRSFGDGGIAIVPIDSRFSSTNEQGLVLHEGKLTIAVGGDGKALVVRLGPDGSLDRSFGAAGTATTITNSRAAGLVVQPDGRAVVMGESITRLLPDGSPDTGFGSAGVVKMPEKVRAEAIALQPDGRLLLAGTLLEETSHTPRDFALVRLNSDGSFDSGLGGGSGYVATDISGGTHDEAAALALLPDGGALLVGQAYPDPFQFATVAAARYGPDGALVPSFGAGGTFSARPMVAAKDAVFDLVVDDQGGVITTGRGGGKIATTRFLPNGTLDPAFGQGGSVIATVSGAPLGEQGRSIVRQPDGRLLVGAGSAVGGAMLRYLPDGSPDPSFGDGGKVTTPAMDNVFDLALDRQGRIVAAGVGSEPCELVLARFDSSGAPDPTFAGGAGAVQWKVAGACRTNSLTVAVAPGGRIILVNEGRHGFVIAFTPAGERIKSFGRSPDGRLTRRLPTILRDVEVDSRGRILVAGDIKGRFTLVRLRPDGSADPSFGRAGVVRTSIQRKSQIIEVRVEPGGKILAAGNSRRCKSRFSCSSFATVARYTGDGSLDPSFGRGGVWLKRVAFGSEVNALALGKGTVTIGGRALAGRESYQYLLARLHR
jgi:uncharacterized delta-60 repeat protein